MSSSVINSGNVPCKPPANDSDVLISASITNPLVSPALAIHSTNILAFESKYQIDIGTFHNDYCPDTASTPPTKKRIDPSPSYQALNFVETTLPLYLGF